MCRRFLLLLVIGVAFAVQAVLGAYAAAATPAWTTYRHDPARSGIDPDSTGPVTPSQAWQTPALDGEVYGQPLVYGSHVYVATENDTVYELDTATGPSLPTSGETLTIEESMTLRARTENAGHVADEYEWSWGSG